MCLSKPALPAASWLALAEAQQRLDSIMDAPDIFALFRQQSGNVAVEAVRGRVA